MKNNVVIATLQPVLIVLCLCPYSRSQTTNPSETVQINLEQYGWQRLPPPRRHEGWPTVANLMKVDSKGRVVIGYPAREEEGLARREDPKVLFHVLRFTPDGKLDLTFVLPTSSVSDNAVYLDAEDNIFAVADDKLQLLIGDSQVSTSRWRWKPLISCSWSSEFCQISQTVTRRKLYVSRCLGPVQRKLCEDPVTVTYDTSSPEPEVISRCLRPHAGQTDTFGYSSGSRGMDYFTLRHLSCSSDSEQELGVHDPVSAVLNDDRFVVNRLKKRWEIGVVTASGATKFRVQLPKHDMPALGSRYVKGDASGDRFAIVIDTMRGGNKALDVGGRLRARRLLVYRSDSGTELANLRVYPPVPHYGVALGIVPGFTFDLSPDGHVLAVLSEGIVTIAKIQ